jgi:Ca-activated chloride channel family protein
METTTMTERIPTPTPNRRSSLLLVALFAATLALGAAHHAHTAGIAQPTDPNTTVSSSKIEAGSGAVHISGTLDRTAVMQGRDGLVRMELLIEGRAAGKIAMPQIPTDLVVVLDRSGSMTGQKIADARAAIHYIISRLGPEDRFALVPFSNGATTAIPLSHATPMATEGWSRIVDSIEAGGGTNMATGLRIGLRTIETARAVSRSPRVILISDGLAAETHAELRGEASRAARGEFTLSAVGVGSDFDETLMAMLADAGTGNYFYLEDSRNLADVFAAEFETARETVASGLSVTLTPGDGVEVIEAAGYPLSRSGRDVTFNPGALFSNQKRRIWVTFRVPTDRPVERELGEVRVAYRAGSQRAELHLDDFPKIACVVDESDFYASLDEDAWARSVAVEGYNQLRQNVAKHVKSGRPEEAKREIADFQDRYRAFNAVMAAPAVAESIGAADTLEAEVDDAFTGPDQSKKQNSLGKTLHSQGVSERRVGSRK